MSLFPYFSVWFHKEGRQEGKNSKSSLSHKMLSGLSLTWRTATGKLLYIFPALRATMTLSSNSSGLAPMSTLSTYRLMLVCGGVEQWFLDFFFRLLLKSSTVVPWRAERRFELLCWKEALTLPDFFLIMPPTLTMLTLTAGSILFAISETWFWMILMYQIY